MKLEELKTHSSIYHLNTKLMTPTFNEFQPMIHERKFDITALSKTWLENKKYLLEYVTIPGYKLSYRNREKKKEVVLEHLLKTA